MADRPRSARSDTDDFSAPGRNRILVALGMAAGSVDAAAYLGLGHAFPANMTGNTVLLVIAIARGSTSDAARSALALAGFAAGVLVGVRLERPDRPWPAGAPRALALQTATLAGILVVWWLTARHGSGLRMALLTVAGGAMGLQSVTTRAAHVEGVATTYITGTLTNALATFGRRTGRDDVRRGELSGAVWALYGAGALAGALIEIHAGAAAIILPTVVLLGVTAVAIAAARGVWTERHGFRAVRSKPRPRR